MADKPKEPKPDKEPKEKEPKPGKPKGDSVVECPRRPLPVLVPNGLFRPLRF